MADAQLAKIKKGMKTELEGLSNTADLLAGTKPLPKGLSSKTQATTQQVDVKQLNKFLDFMEDRYKSKLIKVELKRTL